MKEIAYFGPAFSGRGENLRALARILGGNLSSEGPIISLVTRAVEGPVTVRTVSGWVFEEGPRDRIFASADAVVFVADGRSEQLEWLLEWWENLTTRTNSRRLPVVVQFNKRDIADVSVEQIEEALGIQQILVAGELRMPNPIAICYPHRIRAIATHGQGVRETFDAAAHAAYHGFPKPDPTWFEFAMKMLDAQITKKLIQANPGVDPKVARDALKDDEARERYLAAGKDAVQNHFYERLENDPEFQEMMVAQAIAAVESMVFFDIACPRCKHVHSEIEIAFASGKGPFRVGDALPVDLSAIDQNAYFRARPYDGGQLFFLEGLRCERCTTHVWAGLVIDQGKLASVWPVALTRATLERCHWVSSGVVHEAGRLAGCEPESFSSAAQVLSVLWEVLPA